MSKLGTMFLPKIVLLLMTGTIELNAQHLRFARNQLSQSDNIIPYLLRLDQNQYYDSNSQFTGGEDQLLPQQQPSNCHCQQHDDKYYGSPLSSSYNHLPQYNVQSPQYVLYPSQNGQYVVRPEGIFLNNQVGRTGAVPDGSRISDNVHDTSSYGPSVASDSPLKRSDGISNSAIDKAQSAQEDIEGPEPLATPIMAGPSTIEILSTTPTSALAESKKKTPFPQLNSTQSSAQNVGAQEKLIGFQKIFKIKDSDTPLIRKEKQTTNSTPHSSAAKTEDKRQKIQAKNVPENQKNVDAVKPKPGTRRNSNSPEKVSNQGTSGTRFPLDISTLPTKKRKDSSS